MSIRRAAQFSMERTLKSCDLHRIYKISFENNMKYVGQTKRMPEVRLKEHKKTTSNCTLLKKEFEKNTPYSMTTLAVCGPHQVNVLEKVSIALEDALGQHGLNMTIGGAGVKKPDTKYYKFCEDVKLVKALVDTKHFVSYDILFMRGDISLTEDEFNAVKRFV
ncbi:GIY-YIG catalytic domain-containing endonuclease [Paramecium bursaria Chlorella virus NE-JV-1]|nr:GIY-YIG catalytic domain-containing endonuclease [Paramecium bursaria Chlorella virus NE-JV-1]